MELPQEISDYLAQILNQAKNGIVLTDPNQEDNPLIYVNQAFSDQFGYTIQETVGRNCRFLQKDDTDQESRLLIREALAKQASVTVTLRNYTKDGILVHNEVAISPIFDAQNRLKFFLGIQKDATKEQELIDEQKELKQTMLDAKEYAEKANKAKGEFLANMSHEIRTPLNAMLGFVDILRDRTTEPESKKYLDTIDSSGHHLLGVINDILDFSKLGSKKLEVESIDFDVQKEFSTIYELFSARVSEKNIDLVMDTDTSLPKALVADPLRLKQVISNLLSNAIKFTSNHKKIYLTISYSDEMLHVNVKDEGVGVAKENQQKIFEAFSQADNSTTREFGGTGLGLTISSELVRLMGGELKLKSKLGEGSEFYFSVPASIGKLEISQTTQKTYTSFKGKKVLLAEDNKANQIFMQIVLKKLDVAFDVANDGLEAVEMFGKSSYDLILMDENMPNMNGIGATKEILAIEQEREQKHTPIIALTANALKGDREKFLDAGMDEYLTKPVDRQKLQDVMHQFLGEDKS